VLKEMIKSIRTKFIILFLTVSIIALSAAFLLRELLIKDFKEYLEGEIEDRVYWVSAHIEGTYEHSGWREDLLIEDVVWAYLLGLDIRILDDKGNLVMDRVTAFERLSPITKKRILSMIKSTESNSDRYLPYPLFLKGKEIGHLEVKFLMPKKVGLFIERSNRFLLIALLSIGGITILLSLIFSKRLTDPIKKLSSAAKEISYGNLNVTVNIQSGDEISELAHAFNSMSKTLKKQDILRKKLITNTAHELRTPLAVMRAELEGMLDGLISINESQIRSLYEEVGRLKKILDAIEDLSHAQASSLTLNKQPIKLRTFLEEFFEKYKRLLKDKDVSLELFCNEDIIVCVDPERLSQIIINLLSNSIKATEKGKIWIKAGVDKTWIFIEIGDTGKGIKEEELPFIFERFYKSFRDGVGLGLSIVKELIDAHEGFIKVQSEYEKGSIFTIYLPYIHNSS
jgi:two-component system sensor histidine kinase BaeS